tara:strand:+ start:344 stop:856 length:513 start_codon:yes stop_codon:yes gene_type:complete
MKKKLAFILTFILIISFHQSYSQDLKVNTRITNFKKKSLVLESKTKIITPIKVDFNNYTHLVLENINNLGSSSKGWYKIYEERLSESPLTILNPFKVDKYRAIKDHTFLKNLNSPTFLYLSYIRLKGAKIDNENKRLTRVIVRDYKNKILYSANFTNVSMSETLLPLIFF